MGTSRQFFDKKNTFPLIRTLIKRSILFCTLFLSVLIIFYLIGNYQSFLPENQIMILKVAQFTAISLCVLVLVEIVFMIFLRIFYSIKNNGILKIIKLASLTLLFCYGMAILIIFRAIEILSMGIN